MRTLIVLATIALASPALGFAQEKQPARDARLGTPRTLRDKDHPWTPPKTKAEWLKERQRIRRRILVSQGLWPMPPKTPLKAVVHGKLDRGDYTIEKVYFQSHPGHYVTGNLYRPKNKSGEQKSPRRPGVLCPHGHWNNARFYDVGEKNAKKIIAGGGETFLSAARNHIQARCVGLARLGCVVFHYDMVGYSDSGQFGHRQGFTDAEASLRMQNFMGLQTWNSIRALDFLTSLSDVDAKRIGVTGASGGGTQTFMLCAIDDRPSVAFPAVMVSTAMQGGCICENADYLRIGLNNIALAAVFAPKPMALSGAKDWTINIETKGYPELRQVYGLYGKKDYVYAKAYPRFGHNYNQVAREMMYEWFNRHLKLGHKSPIKERDYKRATPAELAVFNDAHPRPKSDKGQLRKYLTRVSKKQYQALLAKDKAGLKRYREIVGAAADVMFGNVPDKTDAFNRPQKDAFDKLPTGALYRATVGTKSGGELIPMNVLMPRNANGNAVTWIDGGGIASLFGKDRNPKPAARKLLEQGNAIVSIDVFRVGDARKSASVNKTYSGYTFGYNHPLLVNRVRDELTLFGTRGAEIKKVTLVGTNGAGPWTLLAASRLGKRVDRVIVDLNGFSFSKITKTSDPNFLPGALKYGGIGGLAALAAPTELVIYGTKGIPAAELAPLKQVYKAAGAKLTLHEGRLKDDLVVKEVRKK